MMPGAALDLWLMLGGFAIGLTAMPLLIKLAHTLRFLDAPAHRKVHLDSVPLLGGLGIFAGGSGAAIAFILLNPLPNETLMKAGFIGGAGLLGLLLGLVDDRYELRARYKFYGQLLIATAF